MSNKSVPLTDPSLAPYVKNPNQTVIQQLGLNGPQGFSRLMLALLVKFDPECKGIELTQEDIEKVYEVSVIQGKQNVSVRGKPTSLVLQLRTDAESEQDIKDDEANSNP